MMRCKTSAERGCVQKPLIRNEEMLQLDQHEDIVNGHSGHSRYY